MLSQRTSDLNAEQIPIYKKRIFLLHDFLDASAACHFQVYKGKIMANGKVVEVTDSGADAFVELKTGTDISFAIKWRAADKSWPEYEFGLVRKRQNSIGLGVLPAIADSSFFLYRALMKKSGDTAFYLPPEFEITQSENVSMRFLSLKEIGQVVRTSFAMENNQACEIDLRGVVLSTDIVQLASFLDARKSLGAEKTSFILDDEIRKCLENYRRAKELYLQQMQISDGDLPELPQGQSAADEKEDKCQKQGRSPDARSGVTDFSFLSGPSGRDFTIESGTDNFAIVDRNKGKNKDIKNINEDIDKNADKDMEKRTSFSHSGNRR
jgi:hypothetical protein